MFLFDLSKLLGIYAFDLEDLSSSLLKSWILDIDFLPIKMIKGGKIIGLLGAGCNEPAKF